jgi:hypothetical protein
MFLDAMHDLLVFHDQKPLVEPAGCGKHLIRYEKALVAEPDGVDIESGEPAKGSQEPVVMVKGEPVTAAGIPFRDGGKDIARETNRGKRIGMEEIKGRRRCLPGTGIHLSGASFPGADQHLRPCRAGFFNGSIRTASICDNNLDCRAIAVP